jgi:hypothetical protein
MSIAAFDAWRANPSEWLQIAIDVARSHSLSCDDPHVFSNGSNLVVGLDPQLALKIFPPVLRHQFVSERAALWRLHGRGCATVLGITILTAIGKEFVAVLRTDQRGPDRAP